MSRSILTSILGCNARAAPDEFVLLPGTVKWLAALPRSVRPIELGRREALVANLLCAYWPRPARLNQYLDRLLLCDASGLARCGLTGEVLQELFVLRMYYDVISPAMRMR